MPAVGIPALLYCAHCRAELVTERQEIHYFCQFCGVTNRIPPEAGMRGLRCGRCRNDLANPHILAKATRVRDSLSELYGQVAFVDFRLNNKVVERQLIRQRNILEALRDYPGFARTCNATNGVFHEIDYLARDIEARLGGALHKRIRCWLRVIIELVRPSVEKMITAG